jgi:sigma-E factor negative regulatory protein RseA
MDHVFTEVILSMTEQTISQPLAESVSALVDNQTSELELQRILKASQSDPEVKMIWGRYQIASSVIRGNMPAFEVNDFAARMSAALDEEEAHGASTSTGKKGHWWQNAARFAVAASVAGGVLLFSQNFNGGVVDAPIVASASSAAPLAAPAVSLPSGYHGQPLSLRTVGMQNGYEARQQDNRQVMFVPRQNATAAPTVTNEELVDYFNELVEAHADNAALNSSQGMLPFARVVLTEED